MFWVKHCVLAFLGNGVKGLGSVFGGLGAGVYFTFCREETNMGRIE